MSRRTITQFALITALAATVVAPAVAQDPLIAPIPRPKAEPPAWPEREGQAGTNPFAVQEANGVWLAKLKTVSPYEGTWVREVAGTVLSLTFTGNEMVLVGTMKQDLGNNNDFTYVFTGTADCSTTKEGLVYGVVSGADVNMTEAATELQKLVDAPFSFRARRTSAGLMVSNIKIGGVKDAVLGSEELAALAGLFKFSKDGTVPVAKSMQHFQTWTSGMTLPSGHYLQHHPTELDRREPLAPSFPLQKEVVPVAVNPACDVAPMPRPVLRQLSFQIEIKTERTPAPPCCAFDCPRTGDAVAVAPMIPPEPPVFAPAPVQLLTPPPSANVPPTEFQMMADAFGQMLNTQPSPVQPAGAMALPDRAMAPCPLPPSARPSLTGTWVREVGPIVYVITITPTHLTVTATAACEIDGEKIVTEGVVITADYHIMQDGSAMVGLITSADAVIDGPITPDTNLLELKETIANLQKSLTDKPFALGVRVYGDTLVIGNVRLPEFKSQSPWCPLSTLGGRYTAHTDKALPKPKAMKPIEVQLAGPPVGYSGPIPGPIPYGPPGEMIRPVVNAPAWNISNPPVIQDAPRIVPIPASELPQPQPQPQPGKKRKKRAMESRAKALMGQAEELRQVQNEWRRFWFNDQPSQLQPERIHGAISP